MNDEKLPHAFAALSLAIAEMRDPVKNAKNPHFGNKFADLSEVQDCIREPLEKHGLLLLQSVDGMSLRVTVTHITTALTVATACCPLVTDKAGPQSLGSAISYARRYCLKALFSMADVDDDGEGAQNRSKSTAKPKAKAENKAEEKKTSDGDWAEATMTPDNHPFKDAEDAIRLIKSIGDQKTLDALKSRLNAQKTNLGKEWERVKGVYKEQGDIIAKGADYETIPF